jgi:hypothetical protein
MLHLKSRRTSVLAGPRPLVADARHKTEGRARGCAVNQALTASAQPAPRLSSSRVHTSALFTPEMPGGYLSHGIYQRLGGEREFGAFWMSLGFPVILLIGLCYLLVDRSIINQKQWLVGSVGLIICMAAAVYARLIH